jgi:phosphatidylinositol-3-phosphatase
MRAHVRLPRVSLLAALAAAFAMFGAVLPSPVTSIATLPVTSYMPSFAHIYVIVMENKEYGSIVGSTRAPYINSLIKRYGLATNYTAVTHPSEPNYLALWGGSTFGVHDDYVHNISARNIADQLAAHGRSWHVYAQDLPRTCSTASSAYGGTDLVGAAGWYARKHEPAISFTDISGSSTRCARITRLSTFSPTAANLELIVPNMTNDMHDGTIAQGDAFLKAFVPRITGSSAFASSLLVITWDEGSTSLGGGGHVATVVVSPRTPAGYRSSTAHNHYSLLRTIEDAWGLGCLNRTCYANDLREFFR